MMINKWLEIVILFQESLLFIINASISYFKSSRLILICFTLGLNISNNE